MSLEILIWRIVAVPNYWENQSIVKVFSLITKCPKFLDKSYLPLQIFFYDPIVLFLEVKC